jgi:hypothetical protein
MRASDARQMVCASLPQNRAGAVHCPAKQLGGDARGLAPRPCRLCDQYRGHIGRCGRDGSPGSNHCSHWPPAVHRSCPLATTASAYPAAPRSGPLPARAGSLRSGTSLTGAATRTASSPPLTRIDRTSPMSTPRYPYHSRTGHKPCCGRPGAQAGGSGTRTIFGRSGTAAKAPTFQMVRYSAMLVTWGRNRPT